MTDEVVIVGSARTPVGAFNGALASLPAHDLGKVAIGNEREQLPDAEVAERAIHLHVPTRWGN